MQQAATTSVRVTIDGGGRPAGGTVRAAGRPAGVEIPVAGRAGLHPARVVPAAGGLARIPECEGCAVAIEPAAGHSGTGSAHPPAP
jgi:hypothetical protein